MLPLLIPPFKRIIQSKNTTSFDNILLDFGMYFLLNFITFMYGD